MPRRKKLNTNGSTILSFSVNVENVQSKHVDTKLKIIALRIGTNDGEFIYKIHSDTRVQNLTKAKEHIKSSIQKAKTDFLNIEISEYIERNYLFFEVQNIGGQQYSGFRV